MELIQNQVAEELAGEIIKTLQKQLRPEHFSQREFVREKLAEQVEKLLPTSGPIVRSKAVGPHVVALIGPTGVGKTTTLAKLAANLKLREKHRVGLITLDTYASPPSISSRSTPISSVARSESSATPKT
jgi:flagellar biosynthesis protein FlhF